YGHTPSASARLETLKKRLNQRAFVAARRLVTWSQWARDSLVSDYGVAAEKIAVIPPGIDTARWNFPPRPARANRPINLLFVGADLLRKGGGTLLAAFRHLPASANAHLHIVTRSEATLAELPNVTVHRGITPNSDALLQLFADADLFVFP